MFERDSIAPPPTEVERVDLAVLAGRDVRRLEIAMDRGMLEPRLDARLAQEARGRLVVGVAADALDRDVTPDLLIARDDDLAHAAGADHRTERVSRNRRARGSLARSRLGCLDRRIERVHRHSRRACYWNVY